MESWQILSWKCSIIFGFIAALLALFQAIHNTWVNRKKLRWEKAKLSYDMVEDLYDFEPAHNALKMTDNFVTFYSKHKVRITSNEIKIALTTEDMSEMSIEIRESFDSLFYYLERIEHSIEIGIVVFADVKSHFSYYADLLKGNAVYISYAEQIGYLKARNFINRF